MKKIFIAFIFCNSVIVMNCSAQLPTGNWLPESLILALQKNDTTNIDFFIKPVEAIQITPKIILMLTYKGEINPVKVKKIIHNQITKYEILHFESFINLMYNSKDVVEQYKTAKFYIYKQRDNLYFEIDKLRIVQKIKFVNSVYGHRFKDFNSLIQIIKSKKL